MIILIKKSKIQRKNPNLNHLVEPSFQGFNRRFVLAFENNTQKTSHTGYYLPNVEIRNYNTVSNGENFFDQLVKDKKVTYENIRKIPTGKGNFNCLFVRLSIL